MYVNFSYLNQIYETFFSWVMNNLRCQIFKWALMIKSNIEKNIHKRYIKIQGNFFFGSFTWNRMREKCRFVFEKKRNKNLHFLQFLKK